MIGDLCVGIDLGTSGVRAVACDETGSVVGQGAAVLARPVLEDGRLGQDPALWWEAVRLALARLFAAVPASAVGAVAVDGTSGTLLVSDGAGRPLGPALMYNDGSCAAEAARIRALAPPESGAHGASSALAKLLRLQELPGAVHALHQADWIAGRLTGRWGLSDENNALKLGYDPVRREWPAWFEALGVRLDLLPRVQAPGTVFAAIEPGVADELGVARTVVVVAGTTDGCAGFFATGAGEIGEAVTSLGSTLVLKLVSDRPVFAPAYGIYSHRWGERWLVGGASNTGGAVLNALFGAERLEGLSAMLVDPEMPTGLDYYPLTVPGERFPISNPALPPRLSPRPESEAVFFQGVLEGIAAIEAQGYGRLLAMGADPVRSIRTVGGGAGNAAWTRIRRRVVGVPLEEAASQEAAAGTARLARQGLRS